MPFDDAADAPRCELCRGTGWVVVPHPACVYQGAIVCRRGSRAVLTCGVACTNRVPGPSGYPTACPAGAECAAAGSITWDQYTLRIGGHDGVALLTEHLEAKAADARGNSPRGWGLAEMYPELVARAGLVPA